MVGAALAGVAAVSLTVGLSSCSSTRTTVVDRAGPAGQVAGGWKLVRYRDALLEVPAAWPVIDLTANPRRCALLNVHAVYLGHQGPDADCPARALGRTEAVQVEPYDAQTREHLLPAAAASSINGEQAAIEPDGGATMTVVASFAQLGVTVTATYLTDPSTANRIVGSVRGASGAAS
jgi:hypothetical protein